MWFSTVLTIGITFACVHMTHGVKVDRVYFESETAWAEENPRVMCDVTPENGEEVEEILWFRNNELVYWWTLGGSIEVYGVLEDRVIIPTDISDWNIQISKLHLNMEGIFSCVAATSYNNTASASFNFIVFYYEARLTDAYVSEDLCSITANFSYLAVHPKPLKMICAMKYNDSSVSFELRLNGTETVAENDDGSFKYGYDITSVQNSRYPEGSHMSCYHFVYDGLVEHLRWTPVEGNSCPAPPSFVPGFSVDYSAVIPGCRKGHHKLNSRVSYFCKSDTKKRVIISCQEQGEWSHTQWPECSGGFMFTASWLFILLNFLLTKCIKI